MLKKYIWLFVVIIVFFQINFDINLFGQIDNKEFDRKVVQVGKKIADQFLIKLINSLEDTIQKEGTGEAVAVYEANINKITQILKDDFNNKEIDIKLLSPRYRDMKNSPDYYEEQAYKDFQKVWQDTGKYPPYIIQEIRRKGKVFYRYYEPLFVKKLCLRCHGTVASLDADAIKRIQQEHPNDNAIGYKLGELRGFIRITIPQTFIAQ